MQVSQSVYATRTPSSTPPAAPQNAWEKGVVTDSRGLPVVNDKGQPLGVAELASDRHRIETRLKEIKDPAYWASRDLVTASTT